MRERSFEDLLADPCEQFDRDGEVSGSLLANIDYMNPPTATVAAMQAEQKAVAARLIKCGNEDKHPDGKPAVARLSWPDGRFRPTTGCRSCVAWCVREALDEGVPILVEPITEKEETQ